MPINKTLINFIIDDRLLNRIEDFRYKNRFPTRAAAIKWLLEWALTQKPSVASAVAAQQEDPERPPTPPPLIPVPAPPQPRRAPAIRESVMQALRDQGYEIGEAVLQPSGQQRLLVRSRDQSAWVETDELEDLAATRITLAALAARRMTGR